ncbi:MAG: hypothetical protein JWS12_305 [Candidatus Saccharibacteria bacterium]|nr:hypothetical protein [Candidatus Saccharibacteria bacterium]
MKYLKTRFPIYAALLRLYPKSYQKQYNQQILQTLADMLDNSSSNTERKLIWGRTIIDAPLSIIKQQVVYAGDIMTNETPHFVKTTSIFSALLLLPFFIFITFDGLSSHSLYNSWFWHPPVIASWLVFMPAAALLLSLGTFWRWSQQRRRQNQTSFVKTIFQWQYNWPMLAVAVLSAGIIALAFGHDSVHCVVHNPVREIRNWQTTWTCIKQG